MNKPEAIAWWCSRFCHNKNAQNFVLQMHGILPKTKDKKARWLEYMRRNRRYQLQFEAGEGGRIYIIPATPEAAWATGQLYQDGARQWRYLSANPKQLLEEETNEHPTKE